MNVDSLISGSSAFSKSSLYICKFLVLEKTLESPLECKEIKPLNPKGNQSWILIRSTDAELRFQYFDHLMWRADSLGKTLVMRKTEGRRRRGDRGDAWIASLTQQTRVWENSGRQWRAGTLQSVGWQTVGHDLVTEQQQDETMTDNNSETQQDLRSPNPGTASDVSLALKSAVMTSLFLNFLHTFHFHLSSLPH